MNKEYHIYTDDNNRSYKLKYDLIIKELSREKIIDKKLLEPHWKANLLQIIEDINKNLNKFIGVQIPLTVELSDTLMNDDDFFNRINLGRSSRDVKRIKLKEESDITLELMKKLYLILRNIDIAINNSFSTRSIGRLASYFDVDFGDNKLNEFYSFSKKYLERRDFIGFLSEEIITEHGSKVLLERIEKVLENKKVNIQIDSKFFIRNFLGKIDLYSDLAPDELAEKNEEFIDKFKKIRKTKKDLSDKFFKLGIIGFSILFGIIIALIFNSFGESKTLNDFLEGFLGGGIYIFSLELLILTLSLFSFKTYNFYSKLVELYDSHISMIESDIHYQTDPQLTVNVSPDLVFQMRKENTQKIHSLPDKALGVLSSKKDVGSSLGFSKEIINKLIDKI